ncbi:PREDICTED: serine/threonine/tyrosine-interacting protein-like isoform X1 [Polistes dominula]|uniref:Serine/threonine/tyrosine-interacting protein-like isoform X1 n=1 Tax=Polistes dominula TaxID=743375 RepID=A0ABM1IFX5_POLDO|nr:PREDICTED: serine/threonine/tyrosine-interacting protein-like isoform X1 [Polistes dominula]
MMSVDSNKNQDQESNENTSEEYPIIPNLLLDRPKEWTYTMRRCMQKVIPGLYIGPYSAASRSKLESLLEHGITHIICVRQDIEAHFIRPNFPDKFKYLVLNIADTISENIIQHFKNVKEFIDEGINSGGQVLVHGNAGISRSSALVIAYLMETYGLSRTYAFTLLQRKRFCINPNSGFMAQLKEYEPIYKAQGTLRNNQQKSIKERGKRTIHQMNIGRVEDRTNTMDS